MLPRRWGLHIDCLDEAYVGLLLGWYSGYLVLAAKLQLFSMVYIIILCCSVRCTVLAFFCVEEERMGVLAGPM